MEDDLTNTEECAQRTWESECIVRKGERNAASATPQSFFLPVSALAFGQRVCVSQCARPPHTVRCTVRSAQCARPALRSPSSSVCSLTIRSLHGTACSHPCSSFSTHALLPARAHPSSRLRSRTTLRCRRECAARGLSERTASKDALEEESGRRPESEWV
jgi:hypothetical protein